MPKEPALDEVINIDDECTGAGKCHGCLKWCDNCGDVTHVCDMRIEGKRCDEHPMPPGWPELERMRRVAERRLYEAKCAAREASEEIERIADLENARRAYTKQVAEDERRTFLMQ